MLNPYLLAASAGALLGWLAFFFLAGFLVGKLLHPRNKAVTKTRSRS